MTFRPGCLKTTLSPDELVCFFVSFTYTFHVSLNVLLFNHLCLYEWPGNEDVVGLLLLIIHEAYMIFKLLRYAHYIKLNTELH